MEYLVIFLLMAVLPAESVMPVAGFAASLGQLSLAGGVVAGTLGSTLGSTILYALARRFEAQIIHAFIGRHGHRLGLRPRQIERAGEWFDHHAKAAVLLGRFVPGLRSAVSVPAGLRRMHLVPFLLCTALGTALWAALLAGIGYVAQAHYQAALDTVSNLSVVIAVSVCAGVVAWMLWRRYR